MPTDDRCFVVISDPVAIDYYKSRLIQNSTKEFTINRIATLVALNEITVPAWGTAVMDTKISLSVPLGDKSPVRLALDVKPNGPKLEVHNAPPERGMHSLKLNIWNTTPNSLTINQYSSLGLLYDEHSNAPNVLTADDTVACGTPLDTSTTVQHSSTSLA
jgi:hypothetical protein